MPAATTATTIYDLYHDGVLVQIQEESAGYRTTSCDKEHSHIGRHAVWDDIGRAQWHPGRGTTVADADTEQQLQQFPELRGWHDESGPKNAATRRI